MMENDKIYQISVSELAAEQIKLQLQNRGTPEGYLRLGVKGGGCSGFSYVLQFEDNPVNKKDNIFQCHGVNIIVDTKSLVLLNGCVLDWEKTLIKTGFKFINPNEKSSCGCGHSFSV